MKGGTLQTFQNKTLSALTNDQIERHLNGDHFIGVYPLLKDNTSWFIAADFDKADWIEDCRCLKQVCEKNGLPAYLERSRSGKGGHVWLFFERPYPAVKSRKIMFQLMAQIGLISPFDKDSSFDRVFPNQDYLSGKGFGNLIALPLNKHCLEQGNNCFINPESCVPYQDQWKFLEEIQRISLDKLDQLYSQITHSSTRDESLPPTGSGKLTIVLENSIKLTRSGLTLPLINFLKRNIWYRKLEKEASLFDEPETETAPSSETVSIKERICVSFDDLDFRYGSISFNYLVKGTGQSLEFEIENEHIRPEFEVLKAYFSKILKKRTVTIDLQAAFQGENLLSQMATSPDLDKINEEIIEIARFRFVARTFFGNAKKQPPGMNLMDIDQLQSQDEGMHSLYESGEKLLDDLLKHKDVIHYRQLRYLAEKHQSNILKIRFVLNPFSFVFLLSGDEQYHLVLETLDTREATYIWHVGKDRQDLRDQLKRIDQQLSLIRNEGRQAFLESQPMNFSRILHDYYDGQKGFIQWKDLLKERLI